VRFRAEEGRAIERAQAGLRRLTPHPRRRTEALTPAPRRPQWLSQFFELSLHGISGVPDVLHRFGQPLFRDTEFVGPVLNFVRLKEADPAAVLRTFVREIIGHRDSPI
jgi:hypothetical protein